MVDTKIPANELLARHLAECRAALDDLELGVMVDSEKDGRKQVPGVFTMIKLLGAARRDGYPPVSMSDGGPPSTFDHRGEPKPDNPDPTGELVATEGKTFDPMQKHLQNVVSSFTCALGDLRLARKHMIDASQYPESLKPPEPACTSCARIGRFEPVGDNGRMGRCRWCYGFNAEYGMDPPKPLLYARAEGRRVTDVMIKHALNPPGSKRSKKRKGRRRAA